MALTNKKNPSYLVKHRRKWQVKLIIPRDVRWAFDNKTTFKRSTGCNLIDIKQAVIERDRIVSRFKENVKLHRSGMVGAGVDGDGDRAGNNFINHPHPVDYQNQDKVDNLAKKTSNSDVDGWIKERLLNRAKNAHVLRYDFWRVDKKKV